MQAIMPRPRPPHLFREVTRHGTVVWYVRIDKGPRTRVAAFGTPEFDADYEAALSGERGRPRGAPAAGTLSWLIPPDTEKRTSGRSSQWQHDASERISYDRLLRRPAISRYRKSLPPPSSSGEIGVHRTRGGTSSIRCGASFDGRQRPSSRKTQRLEFEDPQRPKSSGFPPWTENDVAAYERHWPIGTRQRVWLDVLLYTGLRRGDAVRLGRQHIRDDAAELKTEKNDTPVTLPILPVLATTLEYGPCGDLAFIAGVNGHPFRKESFGNAFAKAARMAGVRQSCHGLRKIAATRCAENGATIPQMNAIFGWTGSRMALHYIEAADRKRLAAEAMDKLNGTRTNQPAPEGKVRVLERKPKQ